MHTTFENLIHFSPNKSVSITDQIYIIHISDVNFLNFMLGMDFHLEIL